MCLCCVLWEPGALASDMWMRECARLTLVCILIMSSCPCRIIIWIFSPLQFLARHRRPMRDRDTTHEGETETAQHFRYRPVFQRNPVSIHLLFHSFLPSLTRISFDMCGVVLPPPPQHPCRSVATLLCYVNISCPLAFVHGPLLYACSSYMHVYRHCRYVRENRKVHANNVLG